MSSLQYNNINIICIQKCCKLLYTLTLLLFQHLILPITDTQEARQINCPRWQSMVDDKFVLFMIVPGRCPLSRSSPHQQAGPWTWQSDRGESAEQARRMWRPGRYFNYRLEHGPLQLTITLWLHGDTVAHTSIQNTGKYYFLMQVLTELAKL